MIEIPTLKVYEIKRERTRTTAVVGKLCVLPPATRILYRDYDGKSAELRKLSALSCDQRAVYKALDDGAEWIYQTFDGRMYRLPLRYFIEQARPGNFGEGEQFYLGLGYWHCDGKIAFKTAWSDVIDYLPAKVWTPISPPKAREPKPSKRPTETTPIQMQKGLGLE